MADEKLSDMTTIAFADMASDARLYVVSGGVWYALLKSALLTSLDLRYAGIDSLGNLPIKSGGVVRGAITVGGATSVATPYVEFVDLGGTYCDTAGTTPKLRLYYDGSQIVGDGISLYRREYMVPTGWANVWYINGSVVMTLDASGNLSAANLSGDNTGDQDLSAYAQTADLGTAAALDVGTGPGNVPQLGSNSKLPAVDGSNLLNITATPTLPIVTAVDPSDLIKNAAGVVILYTTAGGTLEAVGDLDVTGNFSALNFSGNSSNTNTGDQDLSSYVLTTDLSAALSGYVLTTALTTALSSALSGYVPTSIVSNGANGIPQLDPSGSLILASGRFSIDGSTGTLLASNGGFLLDAAGNVTAVGTIKYTPGDSGAWNGTPPTTMSEAIDRQAALLKSLNGGTGP